MAAYSFKSIGLKTTSTVVDNQKSLQPYGIITPITRGNDGQLFNMTTSVSEQVSMNLKDLLLTNWGERLMLYDFGANLRILLTEFTGQEDFDALALVNIKSAVDRWMSYIDLNDYTSEMMTDTRGSIQSSIITITYSVPLLNISDKSLKIELKIA
jgi:phage baseplate assembly protein W